MIILKSSVRLAGLVPQMALAASVVDGVFQDFGVKHCVITSANDSRHSDRSWHYKGRALDFRTKYPELNGKENAFRDEVKSRLWADFDVVMEAVGTDNEHLHVEYDPK